MSNSLRLADLNSLVCKASGVWALRGQATSFEYSDGNTEEENLKAILTGATNLNSSSSELEEKFNDWTSEYHLSPLRANLLRYLDLTYKKTALELGCGCGALTRYLGEQGLAVDAIEGSERRASLAKIRCQDLSNVNVITSNFFDLSLPANHYDVIFFVGVMEYAGRFSPANLTAEASVIQLLEKVRPCLTPEGIIVVAIENRLGRKYLCGAGEDHYGTAFEGIHGYPNYSGIKTWSQDEWRSLLQEAKLAFNFHYPFPDYKLPVLVLSEDYLARNSNAWTHLTGISSRDYHALMSPQDELPFWESAHRTGQIGAFSNSFLIVAGLDGAQVTRLTPFDFIQTSALSRYPIFRTQTRRYRDSDVVEKTHLHIPPPTNDSPLRHGLNVEPWRCGIPLSNLWIQQLRVNPSHQLLVQLSTEYFNYLNLRFDDTLDVGSLLDVSPMNIMVTESGVWQSFDHEWTTTLPIDAPFIFFRGIFYFCQVAQDVLQTVYRNKPTWTLKTGLDSCFSAVGLTLEKHLENAICWEEKIQNIALKSRKGVSTRDFLRLRLSAKRQTVQLFWAASADAFTENQSQTNYISIGGDLQILSFALPNGVHPPIWLRVDPGVDKGIFTIQSIRVQCVENESPICVQILHPGTSSDGHLLSFRNIKPHQSNTEQLLCALTQDPYVFWKVPTNLASQIGGSIHIEIALKWLGNEPDFSEIAPNSNNLLDSESSRRIFSTGRFGTLTTLFKKWRSSRDPLQ